MKRLKADVAALEIHAAETKIECRILQVGLVDSELLAGTIQLQHFSQCLSDVWEELDVITELVETIEKNIEREKGNVAAAERQYNQERKTSTKAKLCLLMAELERGKCRSM